MVEFKFGVSIGVAVAEEVFIESRFGEWNCCGKFEWSLNYDLLVEWSWSGVGVFSLCLKF